MRALILSLLLVGCAKVQNKTNEASEIIPTNCKSLKSIWTSDIDQEVHDLRMDFTFINTPYSYISPTGAACNQSMKWYMITPAISGASFKMEFSSGCPDWGNTIYLRMNCSMLEICKSDFSICKSFH